MSTSAVTDDGGVEGELDGAIRLDVLDSNRRDIVDVSQAENLKAVEEEQRKRLSGRRAID